MFKKTKSLLATSLSVAMLATLITIPTSATTASKQLSGADRYQTALKIAQEGWTTSNSAIIARGDDSADALAAAPLAYAKGKAPILLTKTNEIPAGVLQELKDLGVKNVYIVGGIGAVSKAVADKLAAADLTIARVAGIDRYATSLEIAKAAFGVTPTGVVIANGLAYADALSVSSIAAVKGMPILLVDHNKLSAEQSAYITDKTVYAVGGTGVLNAAVVSITKAERLAGLDRYETNAAVLAKFDFDYSKLYLAKGTPANLVDSLAGSALAALANNPIVLVDQNNKINAEQTTVIKANLASTSTVVALGGTVSNAAVDAIEALRPQEVALTVKSVSAINGTTLSVIFEGKDAVEITVPTLVDGQTVVTFTYEAKEYTGTLATAYVTPIIGGGGITPVTPTAPVVTRDDTTNIVASMQAGMEYNLDNAGYVAYDATAFNVIDFSGVHTLLVRVSAEGINPVSADTTLIFTTNPVANVAPVISNVSLKSSNADTTKAMNGDILTLTFTSDKPVTKLNNFKINGSNPDTFTNVGNAYTVTHLVDVGDTVGQAATFQINVKDALGTYSQTIEATTDNSSVGIIAEYARISNVKISSDNADTTKAMNGDTVSLTFTSNEPVTKLSSFKINGSNPTTFINIGNLYMATHVVDVGDIVGELATFQINVMNAAGIYSPTIEGTNDGNSVTINPSVTLGAAKSTGSLENKDNINEMMTALWATGDSTVQGIAIKPVFSVAGTTLTIKGSNVSAGLLQWIKTQWGESSIPVSISFNNGTPEDMTADANWDNSYIIWVNLNTFTTETNEVTVPMTNEKNATYSIVVSPPTAAELAALTTTPSDTITAGISVGGYTPYTGVNFSTTNATEIYGIQLDGIVVKLPQDSDPDLYFNDARPIGIYYFYLHLTTGLWEKVTIVKLTVTP